MKKLFLALIGIVSLALYSRAAVTSYVQINPSTKQSGTINVSSATLDYAHISSATIDNFTIGSSSGVNQVTYGNNNTCLGKGYVNSNLFQSCENITNSGNTNTAYGSQACANVSSGFDNICIGGQSGGGLDNGFASGDRNTFVGTNAGSAFSTAHENTCIGWNCLGALSIGQNNIGIGFDAGLGIVSGSSNIEIGGGTIISGVYNTTIGNGSQDGVSGSSNTVVGSLAGVHLSGSDSGNTLIGSNADIFTGSKDAIAIGDYAVAPASNTAVIGDVIRNNVHNNINVGFHDVQVLMSSMSVVGGFIQLGTHTAAEIRALTPRPLPTLVDGLSLGAQGEEYFCSDCSTVPVCVSTGTALGAWSLITNRGSVCQ